VIGKGGGRAEGEEVRKRRGRRARGGGERIREGQLSGRERREKGWGSGRVR